MADFKKEAVLEFTTNASDAKRDTDEFKQSLSETKDAVNTLKDSTDKYNDSVNELGESLEENKNSSLEVGKTLRDNALVTSLLDKATGGLYSTVKDTVTQVFELGKSLRTASGSQRALTVSTNTTSLAMKGLRTAIISTGVGTLIVAIGYLVGKMTELASSTDTANKELEANRDLINSLKESYSDLNEVLEFEYNISQERYKRSGASEKQLAYLRYTYNKERLEALKNQAKEIDKLNKAENITPESRKELNSRLKEINKEMTRLYREEYLNQEKDLTSRYDKDKALSKEASDKAREARKTELAELDTHFKNLRDVRAKYDGVNAKEDGYNKEQSSALYELKKERQNIIDEMAVIEDAFSKLSKSEQDKMQGSYQRFKEDTKTIFEDVSNEIDRLYDTFDRDNRNMIESISFKEPLEYAIVDLRNFETEALTVWERIGAVNPAKLITESEIESIRQNNISVIELQKSRALEELELLEASSEAKAQVEANYNAQIVRENKNSTDAIIQLNKIKADSYDATAGNISQTLGALGEVSKEGSGLQKGLGIASALIETGRSAVSSFRACVEAYPAPYGQIAGAVAAVSAVAMGMKQVNQIKKVKTDGTESGGSQMTSGVITAQTQPNVQFMSSSDNQIQTAITDGAEAQNNRPVKTYVVSSDVTTAQELDRKAIDNTTL